MLVLSSWCSPSRIGEKSTGSAGRIVTASPSGSIRAIARIRVRLGVPARNTPGSGRRFSTGPKQKATRRLPSAAAETAPLVVLPRTCPAPAAGIGGSSPRISLKQLAGMNAGNVPPCGPRTNRNLLRLTQSRNWAVAAHDPVRQDGGGGAFAGGRYQTADPGTDPLLRFGRFGPAAITARACQQLARAILIAVNVCAAGPLVSLPAWFREPLDMLRAEFRVYGSGIRAATRCRKCSAINSMPSASGWH